MCPPWDHPRSRGVYPGGPGPKDPLRGSSPLARGLRRGSRLGGRLPRIIPARAGFTSRKRFRGNNRPDHPRSRGVYSSQNVALPAYAGSSPLARGLLMAPIAVGRISRIIPARAGFTPSRRPGTSSPRDHPRSRGVYCAMFASRGATTGSSPLARGLQGGLLVRLYGRGIIPARAGFTTGSRSSCATGSDHPRSRGVYSTTCPAPSSRKGSSPLARGLQRRRHAGGVGVRIIPARAGFTGRGAGRRYSSTDHPRSRGVYACPRDSPGFWCGSSPLARGLHGQGHSVRRQDRIIPARAGFTPGRPVGSSRGWDHPRSRGVYTTRNRGGSSRTGSSPLARGLPESPLMENVPPGIIPARAGFTGPQRNRQAGARDHPRSRGVYTCGSLESQRRATLPDRVCLHCRPSARSAELR